MSVMRFTCIVPVYNVAPYLETCVVSLLHQKEMEDCLEILLVTAVQMRAERFATDWRRNIRQ